MIIYQCTISLLEEHTFFPVFDKAWTKASDKKNSVGGFRRAKLVPYNPDAIDYNMLIKKHTDKTIEKHTSYVTSPGYEKKNWFSDSFCNV